MSLTCARVLTGLRQIEGATTDVGVTPHQLELFYYVAKYRGICAASRNISYGIGQPAISGQMSEIERRLRMKLFIRKPFELTRQGELIYAHVRPFFEGLGPLWRQLEENSATVLRIAIDERIGQGLFPVILATTAFQASGVCFELQTGAPAALEAWIQERRVHLAVTFSNRHLSGVRSLVLAQLGLRLLVGRNSNIDCPGHFWRQGRIAERLIYPIEAGEIYRIFNQGVRALGVEWPVTTRVDSSAVMRELVASGQGVGIGVDLPPVLQHPGILAIPLKGFDRVSLTMHWRQSEEALLDPLLAAVRETVRKMWPAGPI